MPIDRNTAQYITGNPQQPTQSSAPGIWDIDEQGSAQAAGRWPLPPNVVQRSLRFNSADSTYLNRTPTVAGNGKQFTFSAWIKRGALSVQQTLLSCYTGAANTDSTIFHLYITNDALEAAGAVSGSGTSAVFRDPSAWYHIVFSMDTDQTTAANQMKFYVNGSSALALASSVAYTPGTTTPVNQTGVHMLGRRSTVNDRYFSGYMAEVNFIDGQALTPSSFGQTDAQTGQWIPRVYSGSYGTNGFRLQFLDNSGTTATTLGKDTSGMGNNWTPNNFSVAAGTGNDSLRDVPMNYYSPDNGLGGEVIGNYCTLNPLAFSNAPYYSSPPISTITNGNLDAQSTVVGVRNALGTIPFPTTGKWYFEATIISTTGSGNNQSAGIISINDPTKLYLLDFFATSASSSRKIENGTTSGSYASVGTGTIVGVAVDCDNAKAYLAINNSWIDSGNPTAVANGYAMSAGQAYTPIFSGYNSGVTSFNFGQRPFAYTAPSGFKALCTQNLSAPRIGNVAVAQANDYFNTVLYNGTGSSLSVTGTGFQPDLVWIKSRSAVSSHALYDAVRGVQKQLISNSTADESTQTTGLTAFGADGFTVGSLAQINTNAATYVAWQWNAGGSTVTNTQGTLSTQLRASPTAGFSIATFTGAAGTKTFGHGLGVAPSFIITKYRIESGLGAGPWYTYHVSLGNTQYVSLNSTGAATTSAITWNNTTPTADLVTLGSSYASTSDTFVAYCFAAVPGFSAFGSYTGNGSTDGPFVYLGFKPAFLMFKNISQAYGWQIFDVKRNPANRVNLGLYPNITNAEGAEAGSGPIDFLSNGFKIRDATWEEINGNTRIYIYAAFAEIPFQFANAR